jgi:uncharacterized protein (TIGR02145 family)
MIKLKSCLCYTLLTLVFILFFSISCKKDESPLPATILKDLDGNIYDIIVIGSQSWMKENLKTTKLNDGTLILNVTDDNSWASATNPAYCWYNNDANINKDLYGALYNFYSVKTGKLCPSGWHVPSDSEWTILVDYLISNGYNYDGTTSENKVSKSLSSSTGWGTSTFEGAVGNNDYPSSQNKTGFSAMPGGYRDLDGWFLSKYITSNWWSSSETLHGAVWYLKISCVSSGTNRLNSYNETGFSVRCIKD